MGCDLWCGRMWGLWVRRGCDLILIATMGGWTPCTRYYCECVCQRQFLVRQILSKSVAGVKLHRPVPLENVGAPARLLLAPTYPDLYCWKHLHTDGGLLTPRSCRHMRTLGIVDSNVRGRGKQRLIGLSGVFFDPDWSLAPTAAALIEEHYVLYLHCIRKSE